MSTALARRFIIAADTAASWPSRLRIMLTPRQCVEARVEGRRRPHQADSDRNHQLQERRGDRCAANDGGERLASSWRQRRSFGKQTLAHASGDAGIERVIEGGVDSIEHGFFVRDDQLAKMRDRQIAWVPTFAPVQRQVDHARWMGWDAEVVANLKGILDQHAASLVKAHAMGVQSDRRQRCRFVWRGARTGAFARTGIDGTRRAFAACRDPLGHGGRVRNGLRSRRNSDRSDPGS